ncbi:MAG: laccase domain-containing protein, partial [Proteobacteria bacterium]|nr:laccase domain-containing protein [Pseudomonadota bacterium]
MIDLEQPDWPAPASVKAFVTSRKGGVSKPPYGALNLAAHVGDEREAVEVNRALLSKKMELPSRPVWLNQVHSNSVIQ